LHDAQVDLVTETDKACEELIFNHLKQLYPTHKVELYISLIKFKMGDCFLFFACIMFLKVLWNWCS